MLSGNFNEIAGAEFWKTENYSEGTLTLRNNLTNFE